MDPSVADAMRAVRRERFLPPHQRRSARVDGPLEIGHGQTCSQPSTVATMLSWLDIAPGQRVLDVGSGSGWTTALLAHLVGPDGRVMGCEIVPELVETGRANLAGEHMPWATIDPAEPGRLGRPDAAPFERILVSAMSDVLPAELIDQLVPDGVLVVPVDGSLTRVVRGPDGPEVTRQGGYRFVPLIR